MRWDMSVCMCVRGVYPVTPRLFQPHQECLKEGWDQREVHRKARVEGG